jgi:alcohol dehydrogenase (NADP+)
MALILPVLTTSSIDLDTPYVDLLLMHYPCTFKRGPNRFRRDAEGRMIPGEELVNFNFAIARESHTVPVSSSKVSISRLLKFETPKGEWLKSQGIHVVQFSPLGNMNDFYRQTGWSKELLL